MSTAESPEEFWELFTKRTADCKSQLANVSIENYPVTIPIMKEKLVDLQRIISESAYFLVPYDVKRSQEVLEHMKKQLKESEQLYQPREKFTFKSRKSQPVKVSIDIVEPKKDIDKTSLVQSAKTTVLGSKAFTDLTGEAHHLTAQELTSDHQLLLQRCRSCTFSVRTAIGSVRMEGLRDCFVYLGPCFTSVYLEDCCGCRVFASSHQLRVHVTHQTHLYVRINSHPIIEDCSGLYFAPYSLDYDGILNHFQMTNLSNARCWDNVVDFKWHRSTKSPNWDILPVEERVISSDLPITELSIDTSTSVVPGVKSASEVPTSVFNPVTTLTVTAEKVDNEINIGIVSESVQSTGSAIHVEEESDEF